jgi:hypothetical protein
MGYGPYETATDGLTLLAEPPSHPMVTALHMRKVHLVQAKEAGPGDTTRAGQLCCLMVAVPSDQHQIARDKEDGVWVRVPGRKFVGTQTFRNRTADDGGLSDQAVSRRAVAKLP